MAAGRALQWVSTIFNYEPRWALEPDIDAIAQIARERLQLQADAPLTCTFFAQGGFNKLYALEASGRRYMMRVALPVEPRHKTLSEVATLAFVRENCTPLVPTVLTYDAECPDNRLGLEWLLMVRMPGVPAADAWPRMSWQAKEQLVRDVVGVLAALHEHLFEGIGNLYRNEVGGFEVGRIVSMSFFWRQFCELPVSRGPFRTSREYLAARIALKLGAAECALRSPDDSDEEAEAEAVKRLALRLQALLPTIFPTECAERTELHHDDLSWHNILVDSTDRLSGIVDWECVSTMPPWRACQLPRFLVGSARLDPPDRSSYAIDPDTGAVNQLFDEHQREHDQTRLRVVFWEEMARASPSWVEHARAASVQADFGVAVDECDNEFLQREVAAWLDAVEASAPYSLFDKIYLPSTSFPE